MLMTLICRPWITLRDGSRLYARDRGKRAFCFYVDEKVDIKKETVVDATDSAD